MPIRVAIIGAGGMLEHHASGFLAAGAELVAIADVNPDAAAKAASQYGVASTFDTPQAMLATPRSHGPKSNVLAKMAA